MMNIFFETQERLLQEVPTAFHRFLYATLDFKSRLIGIVGPRGVGKTTLLLQYLKSRKEKGRNVLYVSLDDIYFSEHTLSEFVRQFVNEYAGSLLILDEVHKYPSWNQELKNIYDAYPKLQIIFSGSSSLDLIKGNYDLSRRAVIHHLPGLSFREYIHLTLGTQLPRLSLSSILNHHHEASEDIAKKIHPLKEFKDYLESGYYPYRSESGLMPYFQKINATIEKTIYLDIAHFYSLKTSSLPYFQKILTYLALIPPGKISSNNIAKNLRIASETVNDYLEYLRGTSLIRYLPIDARGSKHIRNAAKVFLDNTNMAKSIASSLDQPSDSGQIRELFFLNQLQNAGFFPSYSKEGDMRCQNFTFEIGGPKKSWEKFKRTSGNYIVRDSILFGEKQIIPLFLFGFLY